MSEQVLKIQSQQGFSEQARPGAFVRKLVDFIIPGGGGNSYDLSRSYININVELANLNQDAGETALGNAEGTDTALFNSDIVIKGDLLTANGDAASSAQNTALVRNASMFSASRGMVESIRRVDTLRYVLYDLENSLTQKEVNLNQLGPVAGARLQANMTSSMLQVIPTNVDINGTADVDLKSIGITRDIRIPISDLFGVGNAVWNGGVYGDTRIHLELNMNRLDVIALGGDESAENGPDIMGGDSFGAADDIGTAADPIPLNGTQNKIMLSLKYSDPGFLMPFYVGQGILINGTENPTAGAAVALPEVGAVIEAIQWSVGANILSGDPQCEITTRGDWFANGGAATTFLSDLEVKAAKAELTDATLGAQIRVNKAEIVLTQVETPGPSRIDYTTYSTEEVQANNLTNFNRQYIVEPEAQNLIIASVPSGHIEPTRQWSDYQIAINNENQSGNRPVVYQRNLHQDRILRFMNNRGQDVHSLRFQGRRVANSDITQIYDHFVITETLPITQGTKTVDIQINSEGGSQDLIAYKELIRSI
tara:strand:+ start:268 stop:1881 length:1614 start_codon:yes stop_codon:yes gene_type:complete